MEEIYQDLFPFRQKLNTQNTSLCNVITTRPLPVLPVNNRKESTLFVLQITELLKLRLGIRDARYLKKNFVSRGGLRFQIADPLCIKPIVYKSKKHCFTCKYKIKLFKPLTPGVLNPIKTTYVKFLLRRTSLQSK